MNKKFIEPELVALAKEQDVFDILSRDGVPMTYTNGIYRHRFHDSMVITPGKGFFWFSRGKGSASTIDYYMMVDNMEFTDAALKVLEVMNYDFSRKNIVIKSEKTRNKNHISNEFELPLCAEDNKKAFAYLVKTRGLDKKIIYSLMKKGLIYQDKKYSNAVFIGKDYEGNIVSAFKRSTKTNLSKNAFRAGDQEWSKKEYRLRIENPTNKTVNVFESEIDMLSYISLQHEIARNENYIALGGLSEKALLEFLKHRKIDNINICVDNDKYGHKFTSKISNELSRDYFITREIPKGKDFNDELLSGEKYERQRLEVLSFENETVSMTKKEKIEYVSNLFKEKYQGMSIAFNYPEELENKDFDKETIINGTSKRNFLHKNKIETYTGYGNKLNIGIEKDLIKFLKDSNYAYSLNEKKKEQNAIHKNTEKWHYFNKVILIDEEIYRVNIDVRENTRKETYLHKVRLEDLTEKFVQTKKWQVPLSVKTDIQVGQPPFHFLNDTINKTENQADKEEKIKISFSKDEEFEL